MVRSSTTLGVFLAVLCAGGWLLAADTKEAPAPKAKGQLPPGWSKLGLTDEQKQSIYKAQSEYRGKIEELRQQIRQLEKQERAEMAKVLTDAQKARLRELATDKLPGDAPKEKKPASEEKKQ